MRELVAFAAERNVTLIPEIDLPGHARAILASYPELGCLRRSLSVRRSGGIEDNLICAGKTGSLDFLCALLDEVCDIFPSPWIHIGGDEAHKTVWEQCPACRRALQTQGLTDFEQLQAQFMNRLISHLQQRGRTAICWNEDVYSGLLDSSAVVQYWNELDRRDYVYPQLTHGHSVIFSNIHKCYANYGYGMVPLKSTYEMEPSILTHCNIPAAQVLGFECPIWCEQVTSSPELEYLLFPRLCALAEACWTPNRSFDDFCRRLPAYYPVFAHNAIAAAPISEALPHGEQAAAILLRDAVRMGNLELTPGPDKLTGWVQQLTGDYYTPEEIAQILTAAQQYRNGMF